MPRAALSLISDPIGRHLELLTGLSAITAGFLGLWIVMLGRADAALCSEAAQITSHCALCYPAALAAVLAMAGAIALRRRQARG